MTPALGTILSPPSASRSAAGDRGVRVEGWGGERCGARFIAAHVPPFDKLSGINFDQRAVATTDRATIEARCAGPYLLGNRMTRADVTAICAIDSIRFDMTHLAPGGDYPKLDALAASVAGIEAFRETSPNAPVI
jgi:glutathione S-transferase